MSASDQLPMAASVNGRLLLVTGASGFLGSEVTRLACDGAWQVRALVRRPGVSVAGAEMIVGRLDDPELLRQACNGVAAVIHTAGLAHVFGRAAHDTTNFTRVNTVGTEAVVRAAVLAGVDKVVLASSVSVYGASAGGSPCDEATPCLPATPYAISKYQGELRAALAIAGSATDLAILRFATIYGEGDRGNVARLIGTLARGRFVWPGSGRNRKSLIYRSDAARACLLALGDPLPGVRTFNVSAAEVSMRQIVDAICAALQRPVPKLRVPEVLLRGVAGLSRKVGDPAQFSRNLLKFMHDDVYPANAFQRVCGFSPAVSLHEGIRRQVRTLASG